MAESPEIVDTIRTALEGAIGFQYEVLRLLGRGGMGAVYHAHERALDRPVAIKVLPPEVAGAGGARERFLREARTAARLTHPNIVPLFTFGETAGLVYYVMGYVEGQSLEQRLRRAGRLEPEEATRILEQLAGALEYAHQQGIVHRDVKPDNILIERGSGMAKLTDFGIAKLADAGETLTGTGLVVGTPRYMSPEQASGEELDARSDIYSLGLVGYAMLTGRPPFDGTSFQEILAQQVTRDAPSLRKLLPELPSSAAIAVERALAKQPAERWRSAAEMAAALRESEDDVGSFGQRVRRPGAFVATYGALGLASMNVAWALAGLEGQWGFVAFGAGLLAAAFGIDYALARWKDRRSRAELRRMMTEPPRWWPLWWPQRWRRRDDVWSRLPREVRTARALGSVGVAMVFLSGEAFILGLTGERLLPPGLLPWGLVASALGAASMVTLLAATVHSWLWGRRRGLSAMDWHNITGVPTAHPRFWTRPHIAALLAPTGASPAAEPRTPAELAAAVATAVRQLAPALRERLGDIPRAARQLVDMLEMLDTEIAALARESDPAEMQRLQSRMTALGQAHSGETAEKSEIRRLYASQMDLLRRLERQTRELSARRARYHELLRTLWLQVTSLRAQHAGDEARIDDLSGSIHAICRGVQHEIEGAEEAARLIGSRR